MRAGERIAGHEIIRELARGGQGVVYEARDPQTGQTRALKLLSEEDAEMRARFRREARALAHLSHPGLPRVFDLQEREGAFCIVQELIEGEDLQALVKARGALPPERAVEIVGAIAAILDYVHAQGLIHRDLKPGNVVLERGTGRVVLLDFGMVRSRLRQAWATRDKASLTAEGELLGTPAYMAPEQIDRSIGEIDRRTDVYALGGTLYTLLTGAFPFAGPTLELLSQVLNDAPPDPRQLRPEIPARVAEVCRRCLAKAPVARPKSAGDAAALLEEALAEPAASSRRLPLLLAGGALLGALGLGLALGTRGEEPSTADATASAPSPDASPAPRPSATPTPSPGEALRLAAEGRDPDAMWRYGEWLLEDASGGATQAVPWFERAAEAGVVPAMNQAGRHLDQGLGVPINHVRAVSWFQASARREDPVGLARLGLATFFGRGTQQDRTEGLRLLARAGDHPEAHYQRGLVSEWQGLPVEAMAYFEKASEGGHGDAMSRIAHLLSTGPDRARYDLPRAFALYARGTELGSPHAIHGLARLLMDGVPGQARDVERARLLYERSARLGVRDSSYNLGWLYYRRGEYTRSREHGERAVRLGQWAGAVLLAQIHDEGRGVDRNPTKGWLLLLEGARQSEPTCAAAMASRVLEKRVPPAHLQGTVGKALQIYLKHPNPGFRKQLLLALEELERLKR